MRKRLIENLEFQLVPSEPNVNIVFDNLVSQWGELHNPQLSVLLVKLRFLSTVHQTHHWISRGDSYYGDHLLFQRLYEKINEEIDMLAEKAIGLGSEENVNLLLQVNQLQQMAQGYGMISTLPQPTELAKRSLNAELSFLQCTALAVDQMDEMGTLSRGLDNLLAGIEDVHESHVYLLKQRCKP